MSSPECKHTYVFLRQETRNEGTPYNKFWVVYDVFFCSRCLHTERRKIDARYQEYVGPANEAIR